LPECLRAKPAALLELLRTFYPSKTRLNAGDREFLLHNANGADTSNELFALSTIGGDAEGAMPGEHASRGRFAGTHVLNWVLVTLFACAPLRVEAGPVAVDLELVLAVDVSGSMSRAELLVQRQGYIAALRSPDISATITNRGGVALAYMEWAGPGEQRIVVPLTVVSDATDARRFADMLAESPFDPGFKSAPWETGTSVSRALLYAADMFSPTAGGNRTIDISGDGPSNSGGSLAKARERVIAEGITINGLPIIDSAARSDLPLAAYYEEFVIGGPGAFAIAVDDPSRFETAIRRKLMLEIAAR
jgi:hypothetical protein